MLMFSVRGTLALSGETRLSPHERETTTVEEIALGVAGLSTFTGTAVRAQAPIDFFSNMDTEETTVSLRLTVV